jgi:hypothetical protein
MDRGGRKTRLANPHEGQADPPPASRDFRRHRAQGPLLVITRGELPSADMVRRFITNKTAILVAVAQPGPYIYSVQTDRISRLYP